MVTEIIYPDSDNELVFTLVDTTDLNDINFPQGKPIDFLDNGVTLIELDISGVTFTSINGGVSFYNGGKIVIKIGTNVDLPNVPIEAKHASTIKVYDPSHPNGQYLVHPRMHNSSLNLLVTSGYV